MATYYKTIILMGVPIKTKTVQYEEVVTEPTTGDSYRRISDREGFFLSDEVTEIDLEKEMESLTDVGEVGDLTLQRFDGNECVLGIIVDCFDQHCAFPGPGTSLVELNEVSCTAKERLTRLGIDEEPSLLYGISVY